MKRQPEGALNSSAGRGGIQGQVEGAPRPLDYREHQDHSGWGASWGQNACQLLTSSTSPRREGDFHRVGVRRSGHPRPPLKTVEQQAGNERGLTEGCGGKERVTDQPVPWSPGHQGCTGHTSLRGNDTGRWGTDVPETTQPSMPWLKQPFSRHARSRPLNRPSLMRTCQRTCAV